MSNLILQQVCLQCITVNLHTVSICTIYKIPVWSTKNVQKCWGLQDSQWEVFHVSPWGFLHFAQPSDQRCSASGLSSFTVRERANRLWQEQASQRVFHLKRALIRERERESESKREEHTRATAPSLHLTYLSHLTHSQKMLLATTWALLISNAAFESPGSLILQNCTRHALSQCLKVDRPLMMWACWQVSRHAHTAG